MEDSAQPEKLRELEDGPTRFDPSLWAALAKADVLGIALPTSVGGSGLGFLELCVVMIEVGWSVAPVPALASLVLGAETLSTFGSAQQQTDQLGGVAAGEKILTAALRSQGRSQPTTFSTTTKPRLPVGDGN